MSNRQLALVANGVLVFGVFCPIVTVPFLGGQNFFQNGEGDGVVVIGLAAISFLLIFKNMFRALFVTGGINLLVCIYAFITLLSRLNSIRDEMHADLKDNPFGGLAEAAMQSVQIQWGWILLIGGAVTLMIAAWNCFKEEQLVEAGQKQSEAAPVEVVNPAGTEVSNTGGLFESFTKENNRPDIKTRRAWLFAVAAIVVIGILMVIPSVISSDSFADFLIGHSQQTVPKVGSSDDKQAPSQSAATVTPMQTPQTFLTLSGSGSKSTRTITVPSEWSLGWRYDCSNFGQQGNFVVSVYNSDGSPSSASTVNQLGSRGSDTDFYHTGGSVYLVINSECRWAIRVVG